MWFDLHTLRFIYKQNEPYLPLPFQPQLVLIYRHWRNGRLGRPWYEVALAEIWTYNLLITSLALYLTAISTPYENCSLRMNASCYLCYWLLLCFVFPPGKQWHTQVCWTCLIASTGDSVHCQNHKRLNVWLVFDRISNSLTLMTLHWTSCTSHAYHFVCICLCGVMILVL